MSAASEQLLLRCMPPIESRSAEYCTVAGSADGGSVRHAWHRGRQPCIISIQQGLGKSYLLFSCGIAAGTGDT